MITQERLKELLHYDPFLGEFTHLTNTTHKRVGARAGHKHKKGYRYIRCDGIEYPEHRLVFLYMEGYFPVEVDHKDRIRDNNVWKNLRDATRSENCLNQGIRKDNQTGVKGLSYDTRVNLWVYRKQVNNTKLRESFPTKELALQFINRI